MQALGRQRVARVHLGLDHASFFLLTAEHFTGLILRGHDGFRTPPLRILPYPTSCVHMSQGEDGRGPPDSAENVPS